VNVVNGKAKKKIDVQKALESILRERGYNIIEESDIKEVLAEFSELSPELQDGILLHVFRMIKEGRTIADIFAMVGEMIDGANELMILGSEDSDLAKPVIIDEEDVKNWGEVQSRLARTDFDGHIKEMEARLRRQTDKLS
jgi:hypothetical protein